MFWSKGSIARPTGFLNLTLTKASGATEALPSAVFELRALRDIEVNLGSSLTLTGFVGGINSYDSARNVSFDIHGTLTVLGGIVAADSSSGKLLIEATSITADGASVFIADNLEVHATNGVQLNTLVNRITVESTVGGAGVAGAISVNEATTLVVDRIVAADGAISVMAGDDLYVRDIRNTAGGDAIVVKSGDLIYIDRIEAGTSEGAQKSTGSTITVDAKTMAYEWGALVEGLDVTANVTAEAKAQTQTSTLTFANTTLSAGDVFAVDTGKYQYQVTYGEVVNSITVNSWTTIRNALKYKIEQGEAFVITINAGARSLSMASSVPFSASAMSNDVTAGVGGVTINAVGADAEADRSLDLSGIAVANSATYTVNIGATRINYVSDASATLGEIVSGLKASIDGHPTFVASATGNVISITSGAGDQAITLDIGAPHAATVSTSTSAAQQQVSQLVFASHTFAKGESIVVWAAGRQYQAVASADNTSLASLLSSVASQIQGYSRSEVTASASSTTLTLTAKVANDAFNASGYVAAFDQNAAELFASSVTVNMASRARRSSRPRSWSVPPMSGHRRNLK